MRKTEHYLEVAHLSSMKLKFCVVICYVRNAHSITYQSVYVFSLGYLLMKYFH